jgi:hypothetical protein
VRKYGPNKIRAAIYRHGAPPAICALESLLEQEQEHDRWRVYVADASCRMIHVWSKGSKLPYYSSLMDTKKPRRDERSGEEIVSSIVKRRRKKRRKEVGAKNETV